MKIQLIFIVVLLVLSGCQAPQSQDSIFIHVRNGDAPYLRKYINSGGDIFLYNSEGNTLMDIAIASSDTEIVRILLDHDFPPINRRLDSSYLHDAAYLADLNILNEFLAHGYDVNSREKGFTALMLAAMSNHMRCALLLASYGANPYLQIDPPYLRHNALSLTYSDHFTDVQVIQAWDDIVANLNRDIVFKSDLELQKLLVNHWWEDDDGGLWCFSEDNKIFFILPSELPIGAWTLENGIVKTKFIGEEGNLEDSNWFLILDLTDKRFVYNAFMPGEDFLIYKKNSVETWVRDVADDHQLDMMAE